MLSPVCTWSPKMLWCVLLAVTWSVSAQTLTPQGGEYALTHGMIGDQRYPNASITEDGGYIVWEDNGIDGNGLGIAAQRVDQNFSGEFSAFRVNRQVAAAQERPQVTHLKGGRVMIVWQGGPLGRQNIYLRMINTNRTFFNTDDVQVNRYTNSQQSNPVVAALPDGNAVVVWNSLHQDGNQQGVFGRLVKPNATFITNAFRINQYTKNNQRNPAVAALTNGNFVVVWVSDNQGVSDLHINTGRLRTDIYARIFDRFGKPVGNEFRVNTQTNHCAEPVICGNLDGGFTVAWVQRDSDPMNNWDIYARSFRAGSTPLNNPARVNSYARGDQYSPRIARVTAGQVIVWTSLAQDGAKEGIYGRLLTQGNVVGGEFLVNQLVRSRQIHPMVASTTDGQCLVAWGSYMGASGFDLHAQRYSAHILQLPEPAAPLVNAIGSSRLSIIWPELEGFPLKHYEIYLDGGNDPITVSSNSWIAVGLAPSSTHSFQLAYVMTDGQRSPKSTSSSGTTWGEDLSGPGNRPDGLPDDWQARFWGATPRYWGDANADSDGDGASNMQEFFAGTDPMDKSSTLRVRVSPTRLGTRIEWNTVLGGVYQVQRAADFTGWTDMGAPHFAAGLVDSMLVSEESSQVFYRVKRVR